MTNNKDARDSGDVEKPELEQEAKAVAGPETEAEKIDHYRKHNEKKDKRSNQRREQEKMFQKQVL